MTWLVAWMIAIPGMLVWLVVAIIAIDAATRPSRFRSFGCARCDWAVGKPYRKPWWVMQFAYRCHCVRRHHDWPPIYSRTSAAGVSGSTRREAS